jgi:hypothetical protein
MRTTLAVVVAVAAVPGCGGDSCKIDTTYNPAIDPTSFVAVIDNPMFPLTPGTRYEYQNGDEHVTTLVTSDHRVVLGVTCAVVHDTSMVNGELVEDTYDWYAQDRDGNVWYMGEDTSQLSGGHVTGHDGAWEAGIADAKPGIVMPAMRTLHQPYRQEYRPCEAEDQGEILALDATVTVPAGSFTGCVETKDFSTLEPDVVEHKFYCPGIGITLTVDESTGQREELLSKTP